MATCLLCVVREASANDDTEYEHARRLYLQADYEQVEKRFARLLDPDAPPCPADLDLVEGGCRLTDNSLRNDARAFQAATLIELGRKDEARELLEDFYIEVRNYRPGPDFRPPIAAFFEDVRKQVEQRLIEEALADAEQKKADLLKEQAEQDAYLAYVSELEGMAGEETLTSERSRWVALAPFGIGQFQNDDPVLGVVFASVEVLAGATAIVSGAIVMDLSAEGRVTKNVDSTALNDDIALAAAVNRVSFVTWAAATMVGIVEAQLAFEPSRTTTKQRVLPERPKTPRGLKPVVTPTETGGISVGVTGSF